MLRIHASISQFQLVDVPDLQPEVALLFEDLKLTTLKSNVKDVQEPEIKATTKGRLSGLFRRILLATRFLIYCKPKASKSSNSSNSSKMMSLKNAVKTMQFAVIPQAGRKQCTLYFHATEIP